MPVGIRLKQGQSAPFSLDPNNSRRGRQHPDSFNYSAIRNKESSNKTTTPFYTNKLPPSTNLLNDLFDKSADLTKKGIERNKYNHHRAKWYLCGPKCLHEILQPWEPGWNPLTGFDTRKTWVCDACKKDLTKEKWNDELKNFNAVREEDMLKSQEEHAVFLHSFGITIEALIAFAYKHDCWLWPTWKVVRDIIVPATRETRCRYADLPELKGCFGPATVFMSHCWGATFGDLIGAACHGARKDRIVWIDIFAVRQWPGNVADLDFRGVISRCVALVVSTSPVDGLKGHVYEGKLLKGLDAFLASDEGIAAKKKLPFCRLWCIVEVTAAIMLDVPIVVKGGSVVFKSEEELILDEMKIKKDTLLSQWNDTRDTRFLYHYETAGDAVKEMEKDIEAKKKNGTISNNGIYEYDTELECIGNLMGNLKNMIDVEASECTVDADKVREMKVVRKLEGGSKGVNALVVGVVKGADASIANNILEIDAYVCNEPESLRALNIPLGCGGDERSLAQQVLVAACSGGRESAVKELLLKWNIREDYDQEKEGETKQPELTPSSPMKDGPAKINEHNDEVAQQLISMGSDYTSAKKALALIKMGFDYTSAKKALALHGNNIESACNYLLDSTMNNENSVTKETNQKFIRTKDDPKELQTDKKCANGHGLIRSNTTMFAPPVDIMFQGDFEMAKVAARSSGRWLLINIQKNDVFACHSLNRDVWKDDYVKAMISSSMVFWSATMDNGPGQRFATLYKVTEFPHVALVDPRTGEQSKIILSGGKMTSRDFVERVQDYVQRHAITSDVNGFEKFKSDFLSSHPQYMNLFPKNSSTEKEKKRKWLIQLIDESNVLWEASFGGHIRVVERILEVVGINVNGYDNKNIPLRIASEYGHTKVVKALLAAKNININKDVYGTPLDNAIKNNHTEVIQLLKDAGATYTIQNAVATNDIDYVQQWITNEKEKDINETNKLLCMASRVGHVRVVEMILEVVGINVNVDNGRPLYYASQNGHTNVVEALLAAKDINVNQADWTGVTPLDNATKNNHTEVIQLLKDAGAAISPSFSKDAGAATSLSFKQYLLISALVTVVGAILFSYLSMTEMIGYIAAMTCYYVVSVLCIIASIRLLQLVITRCIFVSRSVDRRVIIQLFLVALCVTMLHYLEVL